MKIERLRPLVSIEEAERALRDRVAIGKDMDANRADMKELALWHQVNNDLALRLFDGVDGVELYQRKLRSLQPLTAWSKAPGWGTQRAAMLEGLDSLLRRLVPETPAVLQRRSSNVQPLEVPEKLTIAWLINHMSWSWWRGVAGAVVAIFMAGVAAAPIVNAGVKAVIARLISDELPILPTPRHGEPPVVPEPVRPPPPAVGTGAPQSQQKHPSTTKPNAEAFSCDHNAIHLHTPGKYDFTIGDLSKGALAFNDIYLRWAASSGEVPAQSGLSHFGPKDGVPVTHPRKASLATRVAPTMLRDKATNKQEECAVDCASAPNYLVKCDSYEFSFSVTGPK